MSHLKSGWKGRMVEDNRSRCCTFWQLMYDSQYASWDIHFMGYTLYGIHALWDRNDMGDVSPGQIGEELCTTLSPSKLGSNPGSLGQTTALESLTSTSQISRTNPKLRSCKHCVFLSRFIFPQEIGVPSKI